MDRETIQGFLQNFGLIINSGVVKDKKGLIYGLLKAKSFKTPADPILGTKSEEIPYESMGLPGFTYPNRLELRLLDGHDMYVLGTSNVDMSTFVSDGGIQRKIPRTIKQLNDVMPILFPDIDKQLYNDALNEREMVDLAMIGREHDIVPLDDSVLDLLMEAIETRLQENNFVGTMMPTKDTVISVINIRTYNQTRNEFRTWVEGLKWDGKPRVRRWLRDFFGATAPALECLGLSDMYLEEVSQAWLLGAIARNFPVRDATGVVTTKIKHEIVPVFVGDQGIGKGTALKLTAGKDKWYVETTQSVKEPTKFLDGVRGHIIVELSETTQIRTADADTLKGFISQGSDQMRKPYGRYTGDYPRHFIMAASTNQSSIFTDVTGNRRFFPMYCDPTRATIEFSDNRAVGQYDVEQMWAEALSMFRNGAEWKVSSIVQELAGIMQEFSSIENPNVEMINNWLDDPMNVYATRGSQVSKELILEGVFHIAPGELIPTDADKAVKIWSMGTKAWARNPVPVRLGGKVTRVWDRVLCPGEIKPVVRLGMKKVDYDFEVWKPALDRLMRTRAKVTGFKDIGDAFSVDGIPPSIQLMLLDNGYIYEECISEGAVIYRVGVMPEGE